MMLPDLDNLIAEVDRICPSADEIERLKAAAELSARLQALGEELITEFVEHARFRSRPWAEIGVAMGVTRQAAQQRFTAPHLEYPLADFTEELSQAMPLIKQVAVQHRHNYIGTEHLLLGVTAEPNAATELIAARGASLQDLRGRLQAQLTLGASQAADRIPWTPYARKTLALAKQTATARHADAIGCDHVILGLIQLGRGPAAQALRELNVIADPGAEENG
jgi:Clp amino terminal domain, pathogenicity island component